MFFNVWYSGFKSKQKNTDQNCFSTKKKLILQKTRSYQELKKKKKKKNCIYFLNHFLIYKSVCQRKMILDLIHSTFTISENSDMV